MLQAIVHFSLRFRGIVVALVCLLIGCGLFVASRAKLDVFPEFVPPQVTVQTEAPGLAPEQVETLVTRPIENATNGLGSHEPPRPGTDQTLAAHHVPSKAGPQPPRAPPTHLPKTAQPARPPPPFTHLRFWSSPPPSILARKFTPNSYLVNTPAATPPDSCTTNPGGCTLREAVLAANSNTNQSVIVFDVNGTFSLTNGGTDDLAAVGDLDLYTDITILGNGPALTVIDGAAADRVFQIDTNANVLIQNAMIVNVQFTGAGP